MSTRPYDRVEEIVGSQKALVDLSGAPQQTVASWKKAGLIPLRRIPIILERAAERGIPLTEKDFLPRVENAV